MDNVATKRIVLTTAFFACFFILTTAAFAWQRYPSCPPGSYFCQSTGVCCPQGTICSNDGRCLNEYQPQPQPRCAPGNYDCGNGICCPQGTVCTSDGRCMNPQPICNCPYGYGCAPDNIAICIPSNSVYCGGGRYCPQGTSCARIGHSHLCVGPSGEQTPAAESQ